MSAGEELFSMPEAEPAGLAEEQNAGAGGSEERGDNVERPLAAATSEASGPHNPVPEEQNGSASPMQEPTAPRAGDVSSQLSGAPELSGRYDAAAARTEADVQARTAGSRMPSRRATLMALGFAVAALLAWTTLQREGFFDATGPREVVRAQVDDLGRGQLRAAYDLFSPRYRQQVPFNEWRELVVTHWRVFRTRELRFGDNEESNGRAVLETHLVAESGDRYVARFTLVRAEGRWWVDDLRWSQESEERGRVST